MTHQSIPSTGAGPAFIFRRWILLAAGLIALCLQVMAQTLTPAAMQSVMQVAALASDDAQSFAGTCLNLASRTDGQPAKPDNHANCPVCLTLLQAQGFAAAPVELSIAMAWTYPQLAGPAESHPTPGIAVASFASRAPPAVS